MTSSATSCSSRASTTRATSTIPVLTSQGEHVTEGKDEGEASTIGGLAVDRANVTRTHRHANIPNPEDSLRRAGDSVGRTLGGQDAEPEVGAAA